MQKITVTSEHCSNKQGLKEQWLKLYESSEPNFFLSWSWIGNWLNSIDSNFILYTAYCDNNIVGLGILVKKRITRNFVIHSTQLHLHRTGNEKLDQTWIEYNDFLLAKGYEKPARKALVDHIFSDGNWDEVIIGASRKSAMMPFNLAGLTEQTVWHSHSYQVDLSYLRENKTDYLSTLSKNTRYQINRSIRSYEKQGEIQLSSASSVKEALQWFDEAGPFHIKRWQDTKVGSGFTNPVFVKFHQDLITKNFDRGFVDLLKVTAGEQVICYLYNFIQGKEIKFYLSANNYDENDSTYKPGLVSHYLAIKHYLGKEQDVYDFMAGESQYKRSLSSMSSPIYLSVFSKPKLRFKLERTLREFRDKYFQKAITPVKANPIKLILTGGQENPNGSRNPHKSDPQYTKATIVHCEVSSDGKVTVLNKVDYVPESGVQSPATNITFKSGSIHDKQLSVVTETEVHKYSLDDFTLVEQYSLPCFNDLHHVFTHEGADYVVNTGLDAITKISATAEPEHISTLRKPAILKYQPDIDYRQIESTKPHLTHPNFGFVLDNKVWVTRCDTMDAICLEDESLSINIGQNLVHDGVIFKNSIYFTNVDGQVHVFDTQTRQLQLTSNLHHFIPDLSGWCRGVLPISSNLVLVGFSKNRASKKRSSNAHSYAKLVLIDILKHQKIWEINTSDLGVDAIFSILPGETSTTERPPVVKQSEKPAIKEQLPGALS